MKIQICKYHLLLVYWAFFLSGCETSELNLGSDYDLYPNSTLKTQNVVIIVIDGPRFKDTWGDPSKQNIPYFANELALAGTNHNRFYNRGATYTTSGHTAITTGSYQWMSNDGSEIPFHPSIFQAYLEKYRVNPNQVQIITSKKKLKILADCVDPNWRGKFNPTVHSEDREDQKTLETAISVINKHHPRLSLIHFRGPDYYGHANDWDNYLKSIIQTDQYTYEIWQFLQNDPFYQDVTTLIVTNDHGRHSDGIRDGFVSHGDFCEGCMHINLYAAGPDFHSNREINKPGQLVDVASTVALLMDINLPASNGSVMWELFK
jgi:hypothetical protein